MEGGKGGGGEKTWADNKIISWGRIAYPIDLQVPDIFVRFKNST